MFYRIGNNIINLEHVRFILLKDMRLVCWFSKSENSEGMIDVKFETDDLAKAAFEELWKKVRR